MARILVTGATGNVGRAVTARLVSAGAGVRAFVRDARTARIVPGAEVAEGDLSAPETLDRALTGIEAAARAGRGPAGQCGNAACLAGGHRGGGADHRDARPDVR